MVDKQKAMQAVHARVRVVRYRMACYNSVARLTGGQALFDGQQRVRPAVEAASRARSKKRRGRLGEVRPQGADSEADALLSKSTPHPHP